MIPMQKNRWLVMLALCGGLAAQQRNGNEEAVQKVQAVTLKDWSPDSSLIVTEHHPPKARNAAIDVHSHMYAKTPAEVAAWVRTMDEVGVQTTVVLTGATGAEFDRLAELFLKAHRGRFQLYCGLDTADINAPDYPQRAVAELVRCYRKGRAASASCRTKVRVIRAAACSREGSACIRTTPASSHSGKSAPN